MEKSIESIWKEGFLKKEALVAPKINDLYNQKSLHLIDRFKRRFQINFWYVIGLALLHLTLGIIAGVPLIGIFLFFLFVPLIIKSQKSWQSLKQVDKSRNSYSYLTSFYQWLQNSMAGFGRIYQFFYPLYTVGLILAIFFTGFFEVFLGDTLFNTIMNDPDIGRTTFWPVLFALPLLMVVWGAAFYSKRIYREDVRAVYGGLTHRLKELIADMEELRN
jgi:hypothetical protein